ncbi:MAG: alpha/beta fold hydrolase [Cyanobacteria bacterium]|nr:alpha/beta fold hydrolase [Cyanobacteria bacterium CG_2015-16_32_12]NCO77771.1 alpha/beta fold hydrolase [Cyanobacteria bacterium CG_2015-22_32_23]NCQ04217.1 alpha/beta fold hydrolase [Cyanobacteria bacterium CG_2015-09_32_10]NCQ42180.1 alpha/beta fold hydrolase [Cyanobacteria bacterium CG_2015-04_32_10]NCS83394.1 alpha/beta fold hydrolase [Cyanobacteria bacterium CG_2015-02_32_10]
MIIAKDSIHYVNALEGNYWQWREQKIYYVQAGNCDDDKPTLLLVHGFGASTDHWRKNIHQLQENFSVWAIDMLGFGRSSKPSWEYTGNLWREQLNDFITEVIKQPTIIAGNSLGGYACLCTAAEYHHNVKGVILLNSAGPFSDTVTKKTTFVQKISGWLLKQDWITYLLFQRLRNKKNIRKTLEKVYLDSTAITDQLVEDIYRPSCDDGALQVFSSVFKSPQGEKIDQLLQKMNCPLLNIWGEADPWMRSQERGEKFKKHYSNLTQVYVKAGHCPHDEIPEEINGLITSWVTEKLG